MERKIKLAAAVSLLGLTTVACAPNPYWQPPGTGYNRTTTTPRTTAQAGVTHNHCGYVHTHVLPAQGLAHHHGNGCMAGATAGTTANNTNKTQPYAYNNSSANNNTYAYNPPANNNPYTGSTSVNYGYYGNSYSTPKQQPNTNNNTSGTYYYDYTGTSNAGNSNVTSNTSSSYGGSYDNNSSNNGYYGTNTSSSSTYGSNSGSSYTASSTTGSNNSYGGGNTYVVQKGDTVFQVMRNTGVYWKDIIRLNNLQAPDYAIQPGQTLRVK